MGLLLEDLRNRRVVRVGLGYSLTAAAVLIGLAMIESSIGLPDWTVRMVAGAAFFAMPFVLVLIWALEDTGPEHLKGGRRRVAPIGGPPVPVTSRTDRTP